MIIEILENDPKIISKVRAIKLLIRSPYDIKTERISQILMDNIKTKNPKLKASIIDAVGRILRNYKTFPEKRKPKEYRTFRKLLIHTFIMPYDPKAHTQVKQEIVKHLPKILVNQPFVPMITQILREIGMDPDPDIAKKAISAYFKFLELYDNTKKRTKMLSLLYNFA